MPITPADAMANEAWDRNFLRLVSGLPEDIARTPHAKNRERFDDRHQKHIPKPAIPDKKRLQHAPDEVKKRCASEIEWLAVEKVVAGMVQALAPGFVVLPAAWLVLGGVLSSTEHIPLFVLLVAVEAATRQPGITRTRSETQENPTSKARRTPRIQKEKPDEIHLEILGALRVSPETSDVMA